MFTHTHVHAGMHVYIKIYGLYKHQIYTNIKHLNNKNITEFEVIEVLTEKLQKQWLLHESKKILHDIMHKGNLMIKQFNPFKAVFVSDAVKKMYLNTI